MSEDIHHLIENSVVQEYLLHISSNDRDRTVWPTAGEFQVVFSSPFRYVFSLDILDAQIPRTQYTVNENRNTLAVTPSDGKLMLLNCEMGSHTDTTLLDALNTILNPLQITASFESAPTNLRLTLNFTAPRRFSFHMDRSTMNQVIGFDQLAYNHAKAGVSFYGDPGDPQRFDSIITSPVPITVYF